MNKLFGRLSAAALLALGCSSGEPEDPGPDIATGVDVSFLDRTQNPCEDFYAFACGNWLREHPVSAERPAVSRGGEDSHVPRS